jgi:hypothetical protein
MPVSENKSRKSSMKSRNHWRRHGRSGFKRLGLEALENRLMLAIDISDLQVTEGNPTQVFGALASNHETAVYRFSTSTSGKRLEFTSQTVQTSAATWRVFGPTDQFVAGGVDLGTSFEAFLPTAGDYSLVITNSGVVSTVPYAFTVTDVSQFVTTASGLGTVYSGTLSPDAEDTYQFIASAGQPIYLDHLQSEDAAIYVEIVDPHGIPFLWLPAAADSILHVLPSTGVYTLQVLGTAGTGGDYHFRLLDPIAEPFISLDTTITGSMSLGQEAAIYQISAVAGQRLHFGAESLGEGLFSWLVFDPTYQHLAGSGYGSFDSGPLPSSGIYTLIVRSHHHEGIDYSFRVHDSVFESQPLTFGETVQGEIVGPGDIQEYAFTGTVGQRLLYDALYVDNGDWWSKSVNVRLITPSGATLGLDGPADQDTDPFTLRESGEYRLRLSSQEGRTGEFTFRLLDLAEPSILPLDTTITGQLETGWETVVFPIQATASQRLYFPALSLNGTASWSLYGPGDESLGGSWFDDIDTGFLNSSGTYLLVLSNESPESIEYSFGVVNSTLDHQPLVLGATVLGTISQPGDIQEYTFTADAGQRLLYDALYTDDGDWWSKSASVRLIGPSGTTVGLNGWADEDTGPFTLLESGDYRLRLSSNVGKVGEFAFRLLNLATQPSLPLDTPSDGQLPGLTQAVWNVEVTAGQQLHLEVLASDSAPAYWSLYGPFDEYVGGGWYVDWESPTLLFNGTYTLVVWDDVSDAVDYHFQASLIPKPSSDPADPIDGTLITLGAVVQGQISEPDEVQQFLFAGTAGQRLVYDALYVDPEPWWAKSVGAQLLSPSGTTVGVSGSGDADSGPFTLPESGTYRLRLFSNQGGIGPFAFRVLDLADQPTLPLDSSVAGELNPGLEAAVYQWNGSAGERLYFDVESGAGGSMRWSLHGPQNEYVGGGWFDDWQSETLPFSGAYALLVWSESPESVPYSFRVLSSTMTSQPLTIGDLVVGEISGPGDVVEYTFTTDGGQRLFYDALHTDPSVWWQKSFAQLISPRGDIVGIHQSADADAGPFVLGEPGTYRLRLSNQQGGTGPFAFRMRDVADEAAIELDTVVAGSLESGLETAIFRLDVTAGQRLYFEPIESTSGETQWALYGPRDEYLGGNWFSGGLEPGVLFRDGSYTLAVWNYSPEPSEYSFRVVNSTLASQPLIFGEAISGQISQPGDVAEFTFFGTAGQRLLYDALYDDEGPWWAPTIRARLMDPFGNLVGVNGDGDRDAGPFTLLESGWYRLELASYQGGTGDFSFRMLDVATQSPIEIGTTVAEFAVTRSSGLGSVSVDFTTIADTATAGVDFQPVPTGVGPLTFTPGETSKTIRIPIIRDSLVESNETFFVVLSNPVNDTIGREQAVGTILNDDGPGITVHPTEGLVTTEAGGTASFHVVLNAPPTSDVTIGLSVSDPSEGSLSVSAITFTPFDWNMPQTVEVTGEDDSELDGDVAYVIIVAAAESDDPDYHGIKPSDVAVVNRDDDVGISILDTQVVENDTDLQAMVFTVQLTQAKATPVTVQYQTVDHTATAGEDYLAIPLTTLTFEPGESSKEVTVWIHGETVIEPDEVLFVDLVDVSGAIVVRGRGVGTIRNDDTAITINNVSVIEGNADTIDGIFTIQLLEPSARTVTVDVATADGTATAGVDYSPLPLTTLTFLPGETIKTVVVSVFGDAMMEPDESFFVHLSAPVHATLIRDRGLGTILNDDFPRLTLILDTATVEEGGTATGRVERNWVTSVALPVTFSVSSAGQIHLPVVTIEADQDSAAFTIVTIQNSFPEQNQTLALTAYASGFLSGSANLELTDQEDLPTLTLTPASGQIAEDGPGLQLTVSRAVAVDSPLTVRLDLSDSDAAVLSVASVVIPAQQTSATFTLLPVDNGLVDGTRPVLVAAHGLYVGCGCTIPTGFGQATVEVLDDDTPELTISVDRSAAPEGLTGAFTATVVRNTSNDHPLTVSLSSSDTDEAVVPANVTIPAGQSSTSFSIATIHDGIIDGPRQVTITASADGLPDGTVVLTVTDIDAPDLFADAVSIPASGLMGSTMPVQWTVQNLGLQPAVDGWVERVYLSKSDVWNDTAMLVGSFSATEPLGAGGASNRQLSILLPESPGDYYAHVVVDTEDSVFESNEENNRSPASGAVAVLPTYQVTVAASGPLFAVGSPVGLSGVATRVEGGEPAANVPVSVRIIHEDGFRRVLETTTDASGGYSVQFRPLPNEAGVYSIAAAHPGVAEDISQGQFALVGMRTDVATVPLLLTPGTLLTGSFTLYNLGSVPLTGLTVEVLGAPASITFTASLSNETLPGHDSLRLDYSALAADTSALRADLELRFTSAEGATHAVPVTIRVIPLTPELVANPGFLQHGMVRGSQAIVTFQVRNTGGAATTPLTVSLPDAPWLSLVSPAVIPGLQPGFQTSITLALTPDADLPLGLYEGSLSLLGENAGLDVPFSFAAISSAVGDLEVSVTNESTFYVAGNPLLAGARVVLRNPFTSEIVGEAVTSSSGKVLFPELAEGNYLLEVSAPKHGTSRSSYSVVPGILNKASVFLQQQVVTYNWTVTPTEIPDYYQVILETTFATNVPAPVVVIDMPSQMDHLAFGETVQIEAVITNHGLIAAEDVRLSITSPPGYVITPLIDRLGTLPAKSEMVIPIIISRPLLEDGAMGTGLDAASDFPCNPFTVQVEASYFYVCDVPVGAIANALLIFNQAMGIVKDPLGAIVSCIGELLSSFVPTQGGGTASGSTGSTGSSVWYGNGSGAFGGGACSPRFPDFEGDGLAASMESEGVCAQVRIRIDQEAVLTRSAFSGVLELNNGHEAANLEGLQLTLEIRDENGVVVHDRFAVVGPILTGISAIDGTGVLAPTQRATASYTFIPTREAAPLAPTRYFIGGLMQYRDPETGNSLSVPLWGAPITVYPDASLLLRYFQQRDVIGDDPFTDEVEPSEPFTLGLLVTNSGRGAAKDFTITSSQPKIIENEKGLLIDFQIVGSQVGTEAVTPSLTVNLGTIEPAQTQFAQWQLTSTLQGRFIEYSATFEHVDGLGDSRTSIIDTVSIHELIKMVRSDRPGDDDLPDFLVNDITDPHAIPDTLYLSDGSIALVNQALGVSVDRQVTPQERTVQLTASMTSGWNYLRWDDPGADYRLTRVVRSDGVELLVGENAWQTKKVFAEGDNAFRDEPRLHLLDYDGTGSYTLIYVVNDAFPPQLLQIAPVSPDPRNAPVDSVHVTFSEEIDLETFDHQDITLTRNAGDNLVTSAVTVQHLSDGVYAIVGLAAVTATDGVYELTVRGDGVQDYGLNPGTGEASIRWSNGVAPVYVKSVGPVTPNPRKTQVDAFEVQFSKQVDAGTWTTADVTLSRNGAAISLPAGTSIQPVSGSDTRYTISGLADATASDGTYQLTIHADGIKDTDGADGLGTGAATWIMDTVSPEVLEIETLATNPRNIVVQTLQVTFSEPIQLSTFTRNNLTLTRDGQVLTLDDRVTIEHVEAATYRIRHLNWFVGQQGLYVLTVHADGVLDLAGNGGHGNASTDWLMDTTRPAVPADLQVLPDQGVSDSDGLTNTRSLIVTGSLAETGLLVRILDVTSGADFGYAQVTGTTFSAAIHLAGGGARTLRAYTVDAAGNLSSESAYLELFVDETAPFVQSILGLNELTRTTAVDEFEVILSETIDDQTFTYQDLQLTRNGGENLITSTVTVTHVDGTNYRISGLGALTAEPGDYQFRVLISGVEDRAGNAGVQPAGVSNLITWTMEQIAGTRIDLTIVHAPSATDGKGEVTVLPASVDWVHEWQSFWVEMWVSTPDASSVGIAEAMVDLQYPTDYLTAQEIVYGPAFTLDQTGTINDGTGLVSGIGGRTSLTDVGDDGYVLLARVRFASTGDDQVPVDEVGRNIGPHDMQMALAGGQSRLAGSPSVPPALGATRRQRVVGGRVRHRRQPPDRLRRSFVLCRGVRPHGGRRMRNRRTSGGQISTSQDGRFRRPGVLRTQFRQDPQRSASRYPDAGFPLQFPGGLGYRFGLGCG